MTEGNLTRLGIRRFEAVVVDDSVGVMEDVEDVERERRVSKRVVGFEDVEEVAGVGAVSERRAGLEWLVGVAEEGRGGCPSGLSFELPLGEGRRNESKFGMLDCRREWSPGCGSGVDGLGRGSVTLSSLNDENDENDEKR